MTECSSNLVEQSLNSFIWCLPFLQLLILSKFLGTSMPTIHDSPQKQLHRFSESHTVIYLISFDFTEARILALNLTNKQSELATQSNQR